MTLLLRLYRDGRTDYAYQREDRAFRPLPGVLSGQVHSWNVLSPGGTHLVFEDFEPRPRPVDPWGEFPSTGPHVLDLMTGAIHPLSAPGLEGRRTRLEFGVAPDGRVAVAENVMYAPEGRAVTSRDGVLAVSVSGPHASSAREIFRHQAGLLGNALDRPVQWSPDGSRLAVSITDLAGDPMRPIPSRVLLLEPTTGDVVQTLDDVNTAGSASWTPDGTRLLVTDRDGYYRLADTETGALAPTSLPGPRPLGRRRWDVVGTAGNDALLIYRQSGSTGRLSSRRLTDGHEREIAAWRGEIDMYLTAAQMPDGYWT